ncbi:hypothetical protein Nmel_012391 [Mimus melanotis]
MTDTAAAPRASSQARRDRVPPARAAPPAGPEDRGLPGKGAAGRGL